MPDVKESFQRFTDFLLADDQASDDENSASGYNACSQQHGDSPRYYGRQPSKARPVSFDASQNARRQDHRTIQRLADKTS